MRYRVCFLYSALYILLIKYNLRCYQTWLNSYATFGSCANVNGSTLKTLLINQIKKLLHFPSVFSSLFGRTTKILTKNLSEVCGRFKPNVVGDFINGKICI